MTLPSQTTTEPRPAEMLSRLVESANMINRIHEALRAALKIDDLCDIVVGVLFGERAMGISRAVLLQAGDKETAFKICSALGALDERSHEALRSEILGWGGGGATVQRMDPLVREQASEVNMFSEKKSRESPVWSRISWQTYRENPLARHLAEFTLREEEEESGKFIAAVFDSRGCVHLRPRDPESVEVPKGLSEVFFADALVAGIRTKKSRFLLIVDKAFEERPIDEVDRVHMNWFGGQLGLAMDNAEIFSDLAATNAVLQELDTLKSNFLSTISHELRTPLTAITGFTRLLINNKVGVVTAAQKQILDRVLAHSERLVNVVNDLIEIAEIDSGSAVNLRVHPVDPLNVLMETLPKLEPRMKSKAVTIEPVVTGAIPKIMADEKGLGRIFYHLIDNAVKFSRENGKVKIEFSADDAELSIHIRDQGIGIPPERLRAIFEAFYQVDSQLARVYEGMGIGLTLTKKLVTGTGGRLIVQSELGRGSTFTMVYPKG